MPPQDVKRNNELNIAIPSDPNWKPPTPAMDPNWAPPTQPFDPDAQDLQNRQVAEAQSNENPIRRGFEWANKPIVNLMSPFMQDVTEQFGHARPDDTELQAQARGFLSGGMKGLSDFMSFQTSPLGLGLEAATAGASGAQNAANAAFNTGNAVNVARFGKLASTLQRPGQIAGAGMVGHGLFNAATQPDWINKLSGLSEAAMGGAGLAHLAKGSKVGNTDLITGKPVVPMTEGGPGVHIIKNPDMVEPGVKIDPELRYTAENLGKAGKILKDFGYDLKGMSGRQIISLADDLIPGAIPRTVKVPTETTVRQPKLKITDYWIDDPTTGKKILNPKYQVKGLTTQEPAVEAQKKRQGQIPYFIEDKETGEIKRNPDHPDFKGTEKKINITNEGLEQARALGGKGLKIGTNIEGAIGELTTGYSAPIEQMMIREGMQNAIDAVKHLGENGQIIIHFDHANKLISIADNGNGMTRHQLQTLMSDLNKSGKADDPNATGGKGVGKATYMLGGDYFSLSTVTKMRGQKVRFRFGGTPVEIAKGTDIPYEVVPNDTPTGTVITTKLKSGQNSHSAGDMWDKIRDRSRDLKAKVTFVEGNNTKNHEFRNTKDDVPVTDTTIDGNGVKVAYRADAELKARSGIYADVLNNGIYQYSTHMGIGFPAVPNMPDRITIDIHPSAKEGTTAYPFPTQRESLKTDIQRKIDTEVRNDLVEAELKRQKERLIKLYNGLVPIDTGYSASANRPSIIFDPGSRMTPEELKFFAESHTLKEIANHIDETTNDAIESVDNPKWRNRLEQTGIVLDPGSHGIHIPNPETDKSTIGINPFINIENHSPEDAALLNTVTQLHEVGHIGQQKGTGKFSFAAWADNPSLGAYMDTYFKELSGHGNITPGHAEEWLTRLGDIYAAYGPDKFYEATQKYHDIVSDPNNPTRYSPEVQELLQLYKESRGRNETTEDLLSRTGERAESSGGGKGSIRGNDKANAERFIKERRQPKPEIVDKLIDALRLAGAKRATQEDIYSVERATRIANANKANTGGLRGFYKQLHELKGEMPKVDFERTKLNLADVNDLINAVDASPTLMGYEKIRAKMGLLKMLSAKREEVPQFNELKLLKQVFGDKFNEVIDMHGGFGLPGSKAIIKDLINTPKAIMASIDMSAPLRQGLPLIHKAAWRNNIGPMVNMFRSQQVFDAAMKSIQEDPLYIDAKEAGLKLTEVDTKSPPIKGQLNVSNINLANLKEEAYGSQIANLIPGVKASERAYVGFLNKLRFDTFKSLLTDAKDAGLHPSDVSEEIANFVNTASGRGKLPGNMDKIASTLNNVFFSPRLIASRVQMMYPSTYIKASPFVRREFLKAAMATASAGLTTTALMSAMGAKTQTKLSDDKGTSLIPIPGTHGIPGMPISADFGKSQFGNTRVENYGGFLPYVTYMGRMLSGERESSTTGKTYILGKGFATPTRLNITEDFMANKLSPVASLAYKILKMKDPTGKEYQFSPQMMQSLVDISNGNFNTAMKNAKSGEIGDEFIPMFIGDVISIMKDDPKHLPLAAGSFFGMGTQTYGKTPSKSRSGLGNLSMPSMR